MASRSLEDLASGLVDNEFVHLLDVLTLKSTRPGGKTKIPKGLTELKKRTELALKEALDEQTAALDECRALLQELPGDEANISRVFTAMYVLHMQRLEAVRLVDFMAGQYKRNLRRTAAEDKDYSHYDISRGLEEVTAEAFSELRIHAYLTTANQAVQVLQDVCVSTLAERSDSMRGDLALAEAFLNARARTVGIGGDDLAHYSRPFYMKCAAGVVLLLWALSECFNNETRGLHIWNDPTFSIFMCIGDIVLMVWMWGLSIVQWDKAGVDYVALLQMDDSGLGSRTNTPAAPVFNAAANMTLVYLTAFIAFNKALRGVFSNDEDLPLAHAFPTLLVGYVGYQLVGKRRVRKMLFEYVGRVLISPFSDVIFRDSYVGDLLTSMVRVNLQLAFAVGYSVMSVFAWFENDMDLASSAAPHTVWKHSWLYQDVLVPLLTLLPLWLRFVQCLRRAVETGQRWPHLCNALKYCSAMAVISFSVFNENVRQYSLWLLAFTCATLFQYWWDIFMDWGLLVPTDSSLASNQLVPGTTFAMRKPRLMGSLPAYLLVASSNLVLRFAWALTLLDMPNPQKNAHEDVGAGEEEGVVVDDRPRLLRHLFPILAVIEVFRRMVWCVLRVEWEQIEVHVKQGKLPLGVAQGEGGGGASKTIASDSASARLAASIQYVQHDSNGSDDDDDEERVLMAGGSLMPMNIAGGRDRGPPSWAHTPDLGVMRSVSAAVAWMHAMAASLVYAIDWHPATDWWLQTFPSTMAFLYSTRLFRACVPVDPTRARAAAPRLVEAVLMALAMLSLMLVAAHVDL
jgi:hypothetical protein